VGVLMGGLAAEFDISMQSGKAVSGALRERGWDVVDIVVDRDLARKLVDARVDVAWVALHGRFGEDWCVQGLLEVMGVPYTGSGVRASAVAMDKIATKRALAHEPGVRLARDWVLRAGGSLPDDVGLPVVVKPVVGGSTIGIGIVRDQGALAEAIVEARKYDEILLVEEYVEGDEITVAVVDGSPLVRVPSRDLKQGDSPGLRGGGAGVRRPRMRRSGPGGLHRAREPGAGLPGDQHHPGNDLHQPLPHGGQAAGHVLRGPGRTGATRSALHGARVHPVKPWRLAGLSVLLLGAWLPLAQATPPPEQEEVVVARTLNEPMTCWYSPKSPSTNRADRRWP